MNLFNTGANWFYNRRQIGVDLGSANVRISLPPHKSTLSQPSVVARNTYSDRITAIGSKAREMQGRTPEHVETIFPIVHGVVDDPEATEALLSMLLHQHMTKIEKLLGRVMVVAVPPSVTDVSVRSIEGVLQRIGARRIRVVPMSVAALLGIGVSISDPLGQMVVDIGAGKTAAGIVSAGKVVSSSGSDIGGNSYDEKIVEYIAEEFGLHVSDLQAQEIKHTLASIGADTDLKPEEMTVYGQDNTSGLPREITISRADVREAVTPLVEKTVDFVKEFLQSVSTDAAADIYTHGIHLVGGVARMPGLSHYLEDELSVSVHKHDAPQLAVVHGLSQVASRPQALSAVRSIKSYEKTATE